MTTKLVLQHKCSLRLILSDHKTSFVERLRETNDIPNHLDWIELDWNALFRVDKIVEKKNQINKMHNTSSSSYQSICPIKVNIKNNNDNSNSNNK